MIILVCVISKCKDTHYFRKNVIHAERAAGESNSFAPHMVTNKSRKETLTETTSAVTCRLLRFGAKIGRTTCPNRLGPSSHAINQHDKDDKFFGPGIPKSHKNRIRRWSCSIYFVCSDLERTPASCTCPMSVSIKFLLTNKNLLKMMIFHFLAHDRLGV